MNVLLTEDAGHLRRVRTRDAIRDSSCSFMKVRVGSSSVSSDVQISL